VEEDPSVNNTPYDQPSTSNRQSSSTSDIQQAEEKVPSGLKDSDIAKQLDNYSLESIVEFKISRFLDQIGTYYPDKLYGLIMKKMEKPLIKQILKRTGNNQVHAAKILGINRNTLRKKMKLYDFS